MKHLKDIISERLVINKNRRDPQYYFHKEKSVRFIDNSGVMTLYYISSSEDDTDIKSFCGFVIISPYDLTYEDTLGRTIQCKAMGAIKYDDVENNVDDIILNDLFKAELIEDKDDCIISYPSVICDSLAMQLPKIIAQSLVAVLSNLYNNNFFGGFFGKHFLKADWYTRR